MTAIVKGAKKGKDEARQPVIATDSAQSKTFINILYGLAEGEVEGPANGNQSILLEETPLQDANGNLSFSNVKVDFRKGTNDQDYIEGFPAVESESAIDVELKSGIPWVRAFNNIDLDAVRVRFKWGPLRKQDATTGDVSGLTIEYAIDIQTDGGTWTEVLKTKITDKTSANYERAHRIDLPKADSGWLIRVRRLTPNSTSEYVSDKMYIEAVTEVVDAKLRYPNTALLGLRYDAETFGNVAKVAVDLKGALILVPTNYNPQTRQYTGMWDGTFKRAYTNNPAWIYYDICTNDRYGLGSRLTPLMIDKWSLYRLAQYCDQTVSDGLGGQEPRFTCNVYLQSADEAFNILMKLAGVFRAIAFWDGTSINCDADIPQDTYFTYSRANVTGGVFEYSGTRARDRHNVVKVAWDNPANHYKTEYEFVRDEKAIAEAGQVRILDLDAWGCTSRGQAQRAGQWALISEQKETRTVSFKVGLDGHIPLPGRVIEIADELFAGRANGGRVSKISADLKSITLDRDDVVAKAGDRLVINGESGKAQTRIVQSISGRVITVTLPFDANSIAVQNVWVLDAKDLATMKFRVISIRQEEKHQFSITALQYNPQKFDEIDNGAFFEDVPISIVNPSIQEPAKDVLITSESRVDQGINITTMIVSWAQAKGAVKYLIEWRKDDGSWIRLPLTGNNSVEVHGVYSGKYQARVTAISAFEISSLPASSILTDITGKQGLPPKLAFIRATGILFGMKLDWGFPPTGAKDTAYTEIQVSPDGTTNIAQLGLFAYPTTTNTIQGLQPNLKQFYRGRLIDRIGNIGAWSDWTNGTTTADPEAVLDLISGHIAETDLAQELQGKIENTVNVAEAAEQAAANAQTAASSAQTASANAQAAATEAKTAASNAQTSATTAQAQASSAQQTANEASAIATNAKNTADQAANTALTASTAAANAKTAADTAKTMAETATASAATANTAATNAQTTATNAQTSANNAATAASKVASDLTTSTNQLNQKIADETSARTTAISQMNDGLTTETTQRKSEDAALLSNIETYKASTNGSLSSLQTQITTNATNTSANTSKITSLDSRLTTNEGKTADAINSAATAQQTANTAVTNAAAAASAVTSLKSELSTGKGVNNIIAPFSDPQELPVLGGSGRTVTLVDSLLRRNGKAYKVSHTAAAHYVYFGTAQAAQAPALMSMHIEAGRAYMFSAWLKSLSTAIPSFRFNIMWFIRNPSTGAITTNGGLVLPQDQTDSYISPTANGQRYSFKPLNAPANAIGATIYLVGNPSGPTTGEYLVDMLMLEESLGSEKPASTWVAGPADLNAIKNALDANASAINSITTRVTNAEGTISSQGNSITQLNNSITSINGALTNKADATALSALTNRVTTAEGVITAQGNSITQLNNSVTSINGTLSSKADATALNSLTTRVNTAEGQITAQGSAIVSIKNDLVATNNAVSTKADSSALNTLDSKVTSIDGRVTSNAGAITSLKSELSTGKGSNLLIASFSDPQVVPHTTTKSGVEVSLIDSALRTGKAYNFKNLTANISNYVYIGNYSDGKQAPVAVRAGAKLLFSFYAKSDVAGFIGRFALRVFNQSGANVQVVTLLWTSTQTQNVSFTTDLIKYNLYISSPIHADGVTASLLLYTGGASSAAMTPAGAILTMDKLMIEEYVGDNKDGSPWVAGSADLNGIYASLDTSASAVNNLATRVSNAEGTITSQGNSITSLRNDLTTTNNTLATKANTSALTSLDTKITSIDGRVTTNTNAVTALQGRVTNVEGGLSTKADASALSNYYTKTEADSATAGAINTFDSQLTIGGVNAVANSEAPRTSTAASNKEYLLYERSAELKAFYDENLDKPVTISFEMSVPIAGAVQVYSSNGSAHTFTTSVNAVIPNQFIKYSVTVNPKTHTASTTVSAIEFYGTYGTGRIPTIRKLQIEAGTKATAWSPSPRDTQALLDANATAIQTTQTQVNNIDGKLTTATNSITSLSSRMSTAEGNITSTNGAVSGLSTRMTSAEGKITNQSDSITSLQNSVTAINGTLANKADSSALTSLTSRVSTAEGNITSQGNSITSLNNSLAVSGKGGANLLIKSNVVGTYNGIAYPHHVYEMGEDWEVGAKYTLLWCAEHVRGTGDNSSYLSVYAGGGSQSLASLVNSGGKVVNKFTFTKNSSGTAKVLNFYMINRPTADKNSVGTVYWAVLVKGDVITTDTWIPSSYDYLPDVTANATAITNLTNTVTQQGNTITSHSNSITSLNNSITSINGSLANKAEASAVQSLDSKVTTIDGKVTSNTSALTALQSNFNGLPNQGVNLLGPEISNPIEKPTNWVSGLGFDVINSPDTTNIKAFQFTMPAASGSGTYFNIGGGQTPRQWLTEGKYIFSFVAKTVGGTPPHPIEWQLYNADSTRLRFNITASLTRFSGVFTVPAGGAAICMLLIGNPTAKAAGQVINIERMMLERQVGTNTTPSTWIAGSDASGMIISTQAKATDLFNTATNQNSATAGRVTSLESRMTSTEGTLSTKADSSALQTLDTKVTTVDGKVNSNANAITSLNSALTSATSTISMNAGSPITDWTTYSATGEYNVISEPTGQTGKVIQLGNNAGNDTIWMHANNLMPFDQTKTYRIRARYRRRSGTGTIYLGVVQKTPDKVSYVTASNTLSANMSASNYVVNAHAPAMDEWQEIVGYYKGRSSSGANGAGSQASPRSASQSTGFIAPMFLANYQNQAGIVELDYLILEDAEAIAGNQANATALTTLDTKVAEVDGRLTTATNSITALGSRMTTAEGGITATNNALSSLSTRMTSAEGGLTNQSNSITSLTNSINSFDSDSLIPDYNLANPEKWLSHYGYDMKQYFKTTTTGKVGNTVFRKDTTVPANCFNYSLSAVPNDRTYRISFWVRCSADSNGSLSIPVMHGYADGLWTTARYSAVSVPVAQIPSKDGNWYFVSATANFTSNANIQQLRFGIALGHTGTTGWWEVQGYKVSPVLTTVDADGSFATSEALSSLTSTVTQQGSTITSQGTEITNLKNSVTSINGTLTTKADASALNTLSNRVTAAEGNITSQGNSITQLNNSVNTINGALSSKADASALNALTTRVTNAEGVNTSQGNSITQLNNSVTSINGTLSQKADAAALSSLSNRVTTAEGNISSQGNSITSLTNSLAVTTNTANAALPKIQGGTGAAKLFRGVLVYQQNGVNLTGNIVIQTPITFTSKMFRLALTGYNYLAGKTDINLNIGGYAYSGTSIIQHGVVNSGTLPIRVRLGVRDGTVVIILTSQAPGAYWQYPKFNIDAEIGYTTAPDEWINGWSASIIAEADLATNGISTIVEPSLLDVSTEITANASAISNLTNTVTQQGNTITSHSNSITSLNNSITSINSSLTTKANASAVSDLDSRVSTAEGKITANTSSITSLSANLKNTATGVTMSASIDVDPDSEWIYWAKNGEVARADDVSALGGKVYRFGNNAGNDHVNARSKAKLPFDQTKTYRIRARYRRLSGTGTVYCSVCTLAADGTSHVNSSNTVSTDFGSSNYFVINQSPANNVWQEVTVYVKGRAAGAAAGSWTLASPRQMPNATAFLSVQFLANYSSAAGMTELDYLIIEDADAIAANDATANALSSLDTRVTSAEGKITSQGNSITSLNNSVTSINTSLASKADSTALTNLANRVTATENSITSQGSSITSLNSSVSGILKDIEVTDTRSTNQPPSWYWANYPKRIVREFKSASTLGLTGMGAYVSLETYVYYGDATGGPIIQIARGTNSKLTAERRSSGASTWDTWSQDIKTISDGLANKAEASALTSLDSKVSVIDGKVSTQASSITNLTTTVGGNTASIQSQQQSIDGLKARATLKLQSGNLVGGVGIENDSKTVDFIIQANRFAIGAPSDVTGTVTPKYAFAYQSTPTTMPNGTVIPAGLYLDNASISYINANKIYADSLSAITGTIGLLRTATTGKRSELSDSGFRFFNENNIAVIELGDF